MPKVGMEPIRREALIQATIAEIGAKGTLDITVSAIARRAGVSPALAHHYFGGKEQLFLSTMRYILGVYGADVRAALRGTEAPQARLEALVLAGFAPEHFRREVVSAWMNFYALALSSSAAARLLSVYQRRLRANLRHALRPLVADPAAAAERIAAVIDGLYLREGLAPRETEHRHAADLAMTHIQLELKGAAQ
ncbi:transcriptional regulator BetI [Marinovum sp.]|uniref:transcriptional regulator BetI n=1 Tax=Marinovum sp. TaxID=2024839 RepID=UPI002B26EAC1|nr:transcriptional regulator BetI [Marinovum sp.]